MNNEFTSIFKNLTDFKENALQRFDKNHTLNQEVKILQAFLSSWTKLDKKQ